MAEALWQEYKATGDVRLRNRLVLTYVPLVKHIVYKKIRELPPSCEVDDLISCGIETLIGAIDRWDPEKGAGLEPFLWTRIHGAVLDELRRRDWAPRSLRRIERDMQRAQETFTGAHGRPPTRAELASMMNMTPSELSEKEYEIRRSDLTSLSSLAMAADGESDIQLIETIESDDLHADPEHQVVREEAHAKFRRAFERLSPREREVAVLLYVQNLTLREIGEVLEVSESRVSQIHSQLKKRIRERLKQDTALFGEVA
ncbi:MAG TPA: FliA/WhiG family RNA polymerase sigma factor [Thermoleophilaceae bacterium]|nr:FliA/WhiG family RNA polymerase sigma factor [Thermoleophilaceae bacterium]